MREYSNYCIATVAVLLIAVDNHFEYRHTHTVSPSLTSSKPFVIGRPAAIASGANILETDAQLEIVLPGSFWTVYSFDIVRHPWCKKFVDYNGAVEKEHDANNIPNSAITSIFGSVGKIRSLNITMYTPTDTSNTDVCAVIRPIYPTRFDKSPKMNITLTYRYKKSHNTIRWYKLTACLIASTLAFLHVVNFIMEKTRNRLLSFKEDNKSTVNDAALPKTPTESQNDAVDSTLLKNECQEENILIQDMNASKSDSNGNDSEYELVPPTNSIFANQCK